MKKELIEAYDGIYTTVEKVDYHEKYGEIIIPVGTLGVVCEKYDEDGYDVDFEINDILGPGHDFDCLGAVPCRRNEISLHKPKV